LRVFLASTLPDALRHELARQIERLKRCVPGGSVRWVKPEHIHLTFKFLGELSSERVQLVIDTTRPVAAAGPPFDLQAIGLGVFPNTRRPNVIWVGVAGDVPRLGALQAGLESSLARAGFDSERRAFHPHLTLGRARRDLGRSTQAALGEGLSQVQIGALGAWRVGSLVLMRSELRPDGPRYFRLDNLPLGSGPSS